MTRIYNVVENAYYQRLTRGLSMKKFCEDRKLQYIELPSNPSFDEAVAHGLHHKHKVYACKPSLVIQKPGFSYNKGAFDDRVSSW